jgi:hypothetical protein
MQIGTGSAALPVRPADLNDAPDPAIVQGLVLFHESRYALDDPVPIPGIVIGMNRTANECRLRA